MIKMNSIGKIQNRSSAYKCKASVCINQTMICMIQTTDLSFIPYIEKSVLNRRIVFLESPLKMRRYGWLK